MEQETIITKMPSVESVRDYFRYIVNAGIPERLAEEEKEKSNLKMNSLAPDNR